MELFLLYLEYSISAVVTENLHDAYPSTLHNTLTLQYGTINLAKELPTKYK